MSAVGLGDGESCCMLCSMLLPGDMDYIIYSFCMLANLMWYGVIDYRNCVVRIVSIGCYEFYRQIGGPVKYDSNKM